MYHLVFHEVAIFSRAGKEADIWKTRCFNTDPKIFKLLLLKKVVVTGISHPIVVTRSNLLSMKICNVVIDRPVVIHTRYDTISYRWWIIIFLGEQVTMQKSNALFFLFQKKSKLIFSLLLWIILLLFHIMPAAAFSTKNLFMDYTKMVCANKRVKEFRLFYKNHSHKNHQPHLLGYILGKVGDY